MMLLAACDGELQAEEVGVASGPSDPTVNSVLISSDPTTTFTIVPKLLSSALGGVWCQVQGEQLLRDKARSKMTCWRGTGVEMRPELVHTMVV